MDDFFPRWYASQQLISNGRSLYDPQNALDLLPITPWPEANQHYFYPAYTHILTGPFSLLPYSLARVIWTALGMWLIWLSTFVFAYAGHRALSVNRFTLLLVVITTSVPFFQHVIHAQFNAFVVFSLALVYYALTRKKYLLAGLFAGGLLFKPQTVLIPLLVILAWALFQRTRWRFWAGFAVAVFSFWLIAEIFEPNWIPNFLSSLDRYTDIRAVIDLFWVPPWLMVLLLVVLTAWFILKSGKCSVVMPGFQGLLVWTICVNALIVPVYGMLHMVIIGVIIVILFNAYSITSRPLADQLWLGSILLLLVGLGIFVIILVTNGPDGIQITVAERVYKIIFPVVAGGAALPLLLKQDWVRLSPD